MRLSGVVLGLLSGSYCADVYMMYRLQIVFVAIAWPGDAMDMETASCIHAPARGDGADRRDARERSSIAHVSRDTSASALKTHDA